jgi:DNA-binding transcriptional regulator YiaG
LTPNQLKSARAKLGDLKTAELAQIIGLRWDRTVRKWEAGERAIPEPVAILVNLFIENPVLITMSEKFRPVYKKAGTKVNKNA